MVMLSTDNLVDVNIPERAFYDAARFVASSNHDYATTPQFLHTIGSDCSIFKKDHENSGWFTVKNGSPDVRTEEEYKFIIDVSTLIQIVNPAELTSNSETYAIDGNRPIFKRFNSFTLNPATSTVTNLNIYADQSKTAHTHLELIQENGMYVV